jgi:hypothetical protein
VPDPTTSFVSKILRWRKTVGGVLLTGVSVSCTYAYQQWADRDRRIIALETAQTQSYTTSEVDRTTLVNLANNFEQFRSDYRTDMSDVRRALMIPASRPADGRVARTP